MIDSPRNNPSAEPEQSTGNADPVKAAFLRCFDEDSPQGREAILREIEADAPEVARAVRGLFDRAQERIAVDDLVIHPETDEEDIKIFANVLGAQIEPATINGGIPFVASGTLANNHNVVVGSLTNGPEIMMLTRAFIN